MSDLASRAHTTVFEHARDAVLVLDAAHVIREVNRAAERIFGPRAALVGLPVTQVLPGWRPPEVRGGAEPPHETELAGQRPGGGGSAYYLRVLSLAQLDEAGQPLGWVLQLHDMRGSLEVEASIRQQKEFFEAVVRNSPVAIVTITRQFIVLSWNPAAERLFGYTPQEALGKHIFELVASEDSILPDARKAQRDVIQRGRVHSVTRRLRKDGTVVDVELLALPVSVGGRQLGFIAIYHDITDLQRARQAAESANQAKSLFLATMSHEIRTPMNAVIGMTGLLLDTPLTGEQREFVTTIRQSSEALLSLLNDVLDFSKIEAGRFETDQFPFDLRQCVESALELLAVRASEKGLELGSDISPNVPQVVVGDASRLRQVLLNLVGNALKFAEQGGAVVSVDGARRSDAADAPWELTFSVQDTGPGIPEEKQKELFQPFNQLDVSVARRFGGTGLGLAISKRLVEAMGGRIWVESEGVPGRGTTFFFSIAVSAASQPPSGYRREESSVLQGRRVLIVDDNAINRRLLGRQLQAWGAETVEAGSGMEALSRFQSGPRFDLALIDHQMPGLDGPTLAARIREHEDGRTIPMVLLTSPGRRAVPPPGLFRGVLSRPMKASQLHDTLMSCFAQDVARVATSPNPPGVAGQAPPRDRPGDRVPLRILLVEDNPTNQRLASLMLDRLGYTVETASNGREAVAWTLRMRFDVVLMDLQMPEMDGLEATRRVRKELPPNVQPWVIAMTANAMDSDREQCFAAGMDDFLTKPIRVEALTAALLRCQTPRPEGGSRGRPAVAPVEVSTPDMDVVPASARIPGLQTEALARLWRELGSQAGQILPELIDTALQSMPGVLEDAYDALARDHADDLGRAAHTLKSNAAWFGLSALEVRCRDIELRADRSEFVGLRERLDRVSVELDEARRLLSLLRESVLPAPPGS
ncbi:response regulator [Myxococcus stipitatus]|uniref:PAS domain-containing hybrid sensor histidine kinase/response regulator n=1 Tax=Myxococcus stipitatus TaxID=83455 RepID=UPI001F464978|nr:response regulator [Myxococcus stipitatus]MCE9666492.1 response regulator [Myxococcus stipitatus]